MVELEKIEEDVASQSS